MKSEKVGYDIEEKLKNNKGASNSKNIIQLFFLAEKT